VAATRTTVTRSRLPSSGPTGSRTWEVVRGLCALVTVGVLVIGVPLALYAGFGTPWPDTAPSNDWIYTDFTARDTLAVLVVVVWLAWLHFVVCLLVEAVSERRGRGLSPHVPGSGVGTQALARRLVSAVLLLSGGVTLAMPLASADPADHPAETTSAQRDTTHLEHSGDVVGHQADGSPAGFVKQTPRGVTEKYVEVQPPKGRHYDTMWGIAERYLGDGLRYKEIAALNMGTVQPDGTTLRNPDLIYPGWVLRMPLDAEGPGIRVADQHAVPVQPHERAPRPGHGSGHSRDSGGKPPTGHVTANAVDADGASGVDARAMSAGGFAVGGALLAAGLLIGLRRRRSWDGGPNPRGGKRLDTEFDLRGSADLASAAFIDRVLRGLSQSHPSGGGIASPTACLVGADGLALTFPPTSRIRLQAPWRGDTGGRTWTFRRSDVGHVHLSGDPISPFPGLVALGENPSHVETLIDVESVPGILSLSGDPHVAREIAIAMGLGLATNPWSDSPRVTFVGFADDLSTVSPEAIRHYDDLATVLTRVDAARRRQQSACAANGYPSVAAGRVADPDRRLWAPDFVVLSGVPSADDVARLEALAADPRHAVGVIVVGDVPGAAVRLVAAETGQVWCGPLGIDLTAHRMTPDTYRDLLAVYDESLARGEAGSLSGPADGPTPIAAPPSLDLTIPQPVEITVMGRVSVSGPGEADPERVDLLAEIVVYLALHPDGVHPNVLSAAIWPRGVGDDVRDLALASTARWLGVDEHGEPRLAIDGEGRWRLSRSGVRLDWDAFRALVNSSTKAGVDARVELSNALSLVTGAAFSEAPSHRYGWLVYETAETDVTVAAVAVARRLAALAARFDDPIGARTALMAGLRAAPACEDLWRDALRLATRFANRADVTAVADDLYAAIRRYGSPRGAEPETDALVDELLPGYRKSAA
jgi:LysM domain-containing protein